MSDYFSVKPVQTNNSAHENEAQNVTPSIDSQSRLSVSNHNQSQDDLRSIHSTQYLVDMLPDNVSVAQSNHVNNSSKNNNPAMAGITTVVTSYSTSANLNGVGSTDVINNNHILPKTDERSPFYVSVPIPNPMVQGQTSISGKNAVEIEDDNTEEYFVREYPTDILMDRFYKWKKVLKGLIGYLREIAYSQEQFARINTQLKSSVKFHFLTDIEEGTNRLVDPFTTAKPVKMQQAKSLPQKKPDPTQGMTNDDQYNGDENNPFPFNEDSYEQDTPATSGFMKFGSGSIQDIQVVLKKHHLSLASQQLKIAKEILTVLIPKLESLRKDLSFKIKEIKDLHNDFKTNMNQHLDITQKLLNKYNASVKYMNAITKKDIPAKLTDLQPKHDPYLLKLQLDLHLKEQIQEENYLQNAYINLQSSGMTLEKIIYSKIQHSLQRYSTLIDSEARLTIKNLCHELQQGILSKPPAVEWDHFVNHHPSCLANWKSNDPLPVPRKVSEIIYPNMKTTFAKCIRAGYFFKKSNFSKEYKKGYFVLTPNYLHEFKSSNFYENKRKPSLTGPPNTRPATMAQNTIAQTYQSHSQQYTTLKPILSIPLNDASLINVTEHHFTLKGKAIFIEPINKVPATLNSHNSPLVSLTNTASNAALSTANAATKNSVLIKKSPFSKLLKPAKSKHSKQEQQKRLAEIQQETTIKEQESKNVVTWTFKAIDEDNTEAGHKHFKKWVQDLKNLTGFVTTNDRMKFIEEKLWKNHLSRSSKLTHSPSGYSITTLNEYNGQSQNVDTTSSATHLMEKSSKRKNKPDYISINSVPISNHEASFRSKLNTPAIDDNGNLITMAEVKNYSFSPSSGGQIPAISPKNEQSNSAGQNQQQRNASLGQLNSVNSPASVLSDGGGYFGIPVQRRTSDQLSMAITPPLSRTTSRGTINRLPKVKVNSQDLKDENFTTRPIATKTLSTGSLPSLTEPNTNELYQKANTSATNLSAAQTSRVHPIRKHKKNVSFGSLNSLMFAKKGGNNAAFTGKQLVGDDIWEGDDDGNDNHMNKQTTDESKIKLNQSLYS